MKVAAAGAVSEQNNVSRRRVLGRQGDSTDLRRKLKRIQITVKLLKAARGVGENLDLEA
ncbi:MAG: hypothetical protein ACLFN5_00375 [bacterium]